MLIVYKSVILTMIVGQASEFHIRKDLFYYTPSDET